MFYARTLLLVTVALGCLLQPSSAETNIVLRDVTSKSGITFTHTDGSSGRQYIVESISAGLALFDYDLDGDVDIYLLNGALLPGANSSVVPTNVLYRNDGDWKFTDVTSRAGVGDASHGLGVTVGDYDNDGDPDLYLNNFGPNVLYQNNGDGSFTDVTRRARVVNGDRVGAGTCFLDIDADGDLDLYVSNYLKFSFDKRVVRTTLGFPVYPSPLDYSPDPDTLYRNNGDGTFTDVSAESGIASRAAYGMGMVCFDYDSDGDTDILVGNDVGANFAFQNDGKGRFQETGLFNGFAYDGSGKSQGTMGVDCADFDNDGQLDIHVTSYQHELATLYKYDGGFFEDVTRQTRAGLGTLAQVTWGNGFVDFDNDGDKDLFIACGHLHDRVDQFDDTTSYEATNLLLENKNGTTFANVSSICGDGMRVKLSSRGAAFDDLDNDGDVDVVILNSRREPTLLRNDTVNHNHWIQLRLQGTQSNRQSVGAKIKVIAGPLQQVDEVHSGRGYQGHFGSTLHFGLGANRSADKIHVEWIGGESLTLEDISADRVITLIEGQSTVSSD